MDKSESSVQFVNCQPKIDDPEVIEKRHRGVCLLKLLPKCSSCKNSKFTLYFNTPEKKLEQVQCPRWKAVANLHTGKEPDEYVITEEATCKEMPFAFCGSCPSRKELEDMSTDKTKTGWYSRWARYRKEIYEDNNDS